MILEISIELERKSAKIKAYLQRNCSFPPSAPDVLSYDKERKDSREKEERGNKEKSAM